MLLGCQKKDYHAKHYNIAPKEKGIWEDLTVVGNTSSCICRTGIDDPKLRMGEEEEEKKKEEEEEVVYGLCNKKFQQV